MENHNMHPVESAGRYGMGFLIFVILLAIWSGNGYGAGQKVAAFADGVAEFFDGFGAGVENRGVGEVNDGSSFTPVLREDGTIATPEEVLGQ